MNKQEKSQEIEALRGLLQATPPTFVLSFSGLTVNQVSALRKKVRASASRYRVVKNRLALRVIKGTPYEGLAPHFEGPTAIAYCTKDPAGLAKVLEEFTRDNQGLQVKAGWVDGRVVDPGTVKALASLPSREVLIARLLWALQSPMTRLVMVLKAPARDLVRAMDEIAKKKQETSAGAPAPGAAPAP
ncbi:MAG: 50S ribosomal protein L10 [Candidatus Rokubacteria bacterium RIFCSPLOWO2_02_FULL_71_18]|nr:MAG: 50S ribosomal protein L10 [Candidatus Rokubacteria bacterium RIFCSPLOWO2_02_FULL_71_18]